MDDSTGHVTTLRDALRLHQRGDVDAAELAYREVLAPDPANVDALHLLGMLILERGHFQAAESLLRSAVSGSPSSGTLRNSLGVCLMRQTRDEDALIELSIALKLGEPGDDTLENLGEVNAHLHREQDSIDCYEKLLRDSPNREGARRALVAVLESAGESQRAADHLYVLVCQDAARERDVLALANRLTRIANSESLLRDCRRRLSLIPEHVGLNQLVGCVLASRLSPQHCVHLRIPEQRELIDSAINHLEIAAKRRPSYLSYDLVGRNLMEVHRPEQALDWLKRAIEINPEFAPAHECYGAARLSLGETDEAMNAFQTFCGIPSSVSALDSGPVAAIANRVS